MDWFTLTGDTLLYASIAMMFCAALRESLETGSSSPIFDSIAQITI